MVTEAILKEIRDAVGNPKNHSSGQQKKKLRAAFDALSSQVYSSLFGEEPASRMNTRQKLNACEEKDYAPADWLLIERLRTAIRASETTLHAKDYSENSPRIEGFINHYLKSLYELLA
jgi:hypothetical protein